MKGALGLTQDEMSAALEKNYAVQAKRLGARIVPVGAALQLYRKGLPVRLVKPTKAELAALKDGEVPDLKGELAGWWYWGKGKTWESDYGVYRLRQDFQHLNPEGRYLQACGVRRRPTLAARRRPIATTCRRTARLRGLSRRTDATTRVRRF